jgi:hypothetical protein
MTDTVVVMISAILAAMTWGLLALSDWLLGGGK